MINMDKLKVKKSRVSKKLNKLTKGDKWLRLQIITAAVGLWLFSCNTLGENIGRKEKTEITEEEYETEALEYSDLINAYKDYVASVADNIEGHKLGDDPLSIFETYCYLQNNGLASSGDVFMFTEIDDNMLEEYPGLDIVFGTGDCHNCSANLCEIYKKCGYKSGLVAGCMYDIYDDKDIDTDSANHCVCFVEDGDNLYLMDPANHTIFLRKGHNFFKSIYDNTLGFKVIKLDNDYLGYDISDINSYKKDYKNGYRHDLQDELEEIDEQIEDVSEELEAYEYFYTSPYEDKVLGEYEKAFVLK